MIFGYIGAACIGLACYALQPNQPQSMIATALLVLAVNFYLLSHERRK